MMEKARRPLPLTYGVTESPSNWTGVNGSPGIGAGGTGCTGLRILTATVF
ncbi:hypothetical protein [Nonomuraea recticatena]